MNSKFIIGDKVRCKIGGPEMLVNAIVLNNTGDNYICDCIYWSTTPNYFVVSRIHENNLEDVKD